MVTWPPPELDAGAEPGDCRPEELCELPVPPPPPEPDDVPELPVLPDVPEDVPVLPEVPPVLLPDELEPAWLVVACAPGNSRAIPPAARRLAAVAEMATARSRFFPRFLD
ncbi:MAG TPA: hypothetical protein VH480_22090 [Streptosporangiaceae bacterium]